MSTIRLDEMEFNTAMTLCKGSKSNLRNDQPGFPSHSSTSTTMESFIKKLIEIDVLITHYKEVLQSDLEAAEKAGLELIAADAASSKNFLP